MATSTRNATVISSSVDTPALHAGVSWSPFRPDKAARTACALISTLIHAAALVLAATVTLGFATLEPAIPVRILQPAPPPPPGMGKGPAGLPDGSGSEIVAPVPAPEPEPQPPAPEPEEHSAKAKPAKPLRVAAKPKQVAKPAPRAAPSTRNADSTTSAAAPRGEPGILGGVRGGMLGGKVGGVVGGRGDLPLRADRVASPPVLVKSVPPVYPPLARMRGAEGLVVLEAVIGRDGEVESKGLRIAKSNPVFDEAALRAFRQWKFRPGRDREGRTVRVIVEQPIRFQLR